MCHSEANRGKWKADPMEYFAELFQEPYGAMYSLATLAGWNQQIHWALCVTVNIA